MSVEQRMTNRLVSYWNLIRKDNSIPAIARFNASAIDDLWQQCVLFIVLPTAPDQSPVVSYNQVGDKVRPLFPEDMVGRTISVAQKHFQGATMTRRIGDAIATPAPVLDEGHFVGENGKVIKYRSCLLPFGTPAGKVTHVIAGLSWREF